MPSFDIVSEVDMHELKNAVDQANRELQTRFDFKGTNAAYKLEECKITTHAPNEFQVKQMLDILTNKLSNRNIDVRSMDVAEPEVHLHETRQVVTIKQGIEQTDSKKLVKLIKDSNLKVQTSIQGEKLRVTGKKRDDLQDTIKFLKDSAKDLPLQFNNFRD